MPDNTDSHWSGVHERVTNLAPQVDLLSNGPFDIPEGYVEWIKGGRAVPIKHEGREVLMPAPFSPTGVTVDMFKKRVEREIRQI